MTDSGQSSTAQSASKFLRLVNWIKTSIIKKINDWLMKNYVRGNWIKTGIIIVLLVLSWVFWISDNPQLGSPCKNDVSNVLTIVGLLLAGSVAGTFAFTYEKSKNLILGHITTGLLILGIGLLLEISIKSLGFSLGSLSNPIVVATYIVFGSVICYDFWDLMRYESSTCCGG